MAEILSSRVKAEILRLLFGLSAKELHVRELERQSGLALGTVRQEDADYLETCRTKRNIVEYEMAGVATQQDAAELVSFARQLRRDVLEWLAESHRELLPKAKG